jgi:hypothetical protein
MQSLHNQKLRNQSIGWPHEQESPIRQKSLPSSVHGTIVLMAICFTVALRAEPAPPKPHTLRIEVLAQSPDENPISWLRPIDFHVSLQGQPVPVSVARPVLTKKPPQRRSVPTRLLVVLTSPTQNSDQDFTMLLKALVPVWQRAWRVAVAESDGHVTPYASGPAELRMLWKAPLMPARGLKEAVEYLGSFMGRRIVLVLSGNQKASTPPPHWLGPMATDEMEEVFVVDGGQPDSSGETLGSDIPGAYPAAEPAASVNGWGRTSTQGSEVNLRHAMHDAMRLAFGYYDLRVKYQDAAPISSDATLVLQIKGPSSFHVAAQVYGKDWVPKLEVMKR